MKLRLVLVLSGLLLLALGLAACTDDGAKTGKAEGENVKAASTKLTIYSGRKESLVQPIIDAFEKETGIKVTFLEGDSSQLANQILEEGRNPRADVYISNDAGTLGYLAEKGGLQEYQSDAVKAVPSDLRADDGTWVGASIRVRTIIYNTELVSDDEAPKSISDLTDPKWKGQLAVAGSANEAMVGHLSQLRVVKGEKWTEKWLSGVLANDPVVTKGHGDIRAAVGAGELKVGLVNHYYYHQELEEGSPVALVYPDQDDTGAFLNVAGLGIVKGAKNLDAAQRFIDFVVGEEAQEIFAGANFELPVLDSVDPGDAKPLSEFKSNRIKLSRLSKERDKTMDLVEKVGLEAVQ
jgi:iron(III) transport system substrate-binding protein